MLIVIAITIFGLSSCKKDNFSSGTHNTSSISDLPSNSTTINLVAGHWVRDINGIYSSNFPGVISSPNVSGNRVIKVYLVESNEESQINNSINFMGGELWATYTQTDVKINYHCYAQSLPFSYMIIKVVVE
jgi:hypothetical protein